MKNYKYQLRKGGKKIQCPNCNYFTFVPFVLSEDNKTTIDNISGRCERINSCGYFKYPQTDEKFIPQAMIYEPEKPADFVPVELVNKTFTNFENNNFFKYLCYLFGKSLAEYLQITYNIGTTTAGGTIFWQRDKEGNYRTGKVIHYNKDGRRSKCQFPYYLHFQHKKDFNLKQVFFGENLTNKENPIALCESEKTAVIMSFFLPECTWIAAGGAEMINTYRLARLPRLDYVFPDNGQRQKWKEKTHIFNPIIDVSVDDAVNNNLIKQGGDILDLYLLKTHDNGRNFKKN